MSLRQPYQNADAPIRAPADESDAEEEALVEDYREQVRYDNNGMDDLDRVVSLNGGGGQDIHAQLAAAATPLEFQATLETKFASYDNYCSLFHYILNSDGPVDLEVPSVCGHSFAKGVWEDFAGLEFRGDFSSTAVGSTETTRIFWSWLHFEEWNRT
jgi:hypothetical protein